jgi:uncharacterized protein YndB with AHSA1/START domain
VLHEVSLLAYHATNWLRITIRNRTVARRPKDAKTETKEAAVQVEREIVFPESPDEVWEALTEPERLEEWFATEVELDARPGGAGVFRWGDGEERRATVREASEEERLVLDWEDDGGEVVLELEEVDGGTRLRLVESTPEFGTALELRALVCLQAA